MQRMTRLSVPSSASMAWSFGKETSTCQTRKWRAPHVISRSGLPWSHWSARALSAAAGWPQMGSPLSRSQMTSALSSLPPSVARNVSLQLMATAWTPDLCCRNLCLSARSPPCESPPKAHSQASARSQTKTSDITPWTAVWPVTNVLPSLDTQTQLTSSLCPVRNVRFDLPRDVPDCLTTTWDPSG